MDKIDFVLPWVNPMDKQWQKEKDKYNPKKMVDIVNSQARYRDMETLKYVLRSIEKNCPWYNKIFLITEGHCPNWLNLESDKIRLVTHKEIYSNKEHLPVFNSSSIEMNLVNIPGLSERFVYLNDDTVIMRAAPIARFFVDEMAVDFFAHGWVPRNQLFEKLRPVDAWYYSIKNNLKLINNSVGINKLANNHLYHNSYNLKEKISNFLMRNIYHKALWIEHWHHPQPYTRTTLLEVFEVFHEAMMESSANRFRENNDLTQYLYRYWHLFKGDFYPMKYNDALSTMNIDSLECLESMLQEIRVSDHVRFVCFNDVPSLSDDEYSQVKEKLLNELDGYFPNRASFETKVKFEA